MSRVRISTTVDQQRLAECRRLLDAPDSRLLDRALKALLDELHAAAELTALAREPYDDDADLTWVVSDGPPLPYNGRIPPEVVAIAKQRKRRR